MIDNNQECKKCGICCRLFLINLNESEYDSGIYKTVNQEFGPFSFLDAKECGANILENKDNGSCVYLNNGMCQIHKIRPQVCREFFCGSNEAKFKVMQEIIDKAKSI